MYSTPKGPAGAGPASKAGAGKAGAPKQAHSPAAGAGGAAAAAAASAGFGAAGAGASSSVDGPKLEDDGEEYKNDDHAAGTVNQEHSVRERMRRLLQIRTKLEQFSTKKAEIMSSSTEAAAFMESRRPKGTEVPKRISDLLPSVVVVGDQSHGKSTLLSALSGMRFPSGDDIVTKCAVMLHVETALPNEPRWRARVFIESLVAPGKSDPAKDKDSGTWYESKEEAFMRFQELNDGGGKPIRKNEQITICIRAHGVLDLCMIDLPGIYGEKSGGDADEVAEARAATDIAKTFVAKRSPGGASPVILWVVDTEKCMSNTHYSDSVVKACDPRGERTIVVFSKCDAVTKRHTLSAHATRITKRFTNLVGAGVIGRLARGDETLASAEDRTAWETSTGAELASMLRDETKVPFFCGLGDLTHLVQDRLDSELVAFLPRAEEATRSEKAVVRELLTKVEERAVPPNRREIYTRNFCREILRRWSVHGEKALKDHIVNGRNQLATKLESHRPTSVSDLIVQARAWSKAGETASIFHHPGDVHLAPLKAATDAFVEPGHEFIDAVGEQIKADLRVYVTESVEGLPVFRDTALELVSELVDAAVFKSREEWAGKAGLLSSDYARGKAVDRAIEAADAFLTCKKEISSAAAAYLNEGDSQGEPRGERRLAALATQLSMFWFGDLEEARRAVDTFAEKLESRRNQYVVTLQGVTPALAALEVTAALVERIKIHCAEEMNDTIVQILSSGWAREVARAYYALVTLAVESASSEISALIDTHVIKKIAPVLEKDFLDRLVGRLNPAESANRLFTPDPSTETLLNQLHAAYDIIEDF